MREKQKKCQGIFFLVATKGTGKYGEIQYVMREGQNELWPVQLLILHQYFNRLGDNHQGCNKKAR